MSGAERLPSGGVVRRRPGDTAVHLDSMADDSPVHSTYPTGYDSACNWCWLNATHSEMAHATSRARTLARSTPLAP